MTREDTSTPEERARLVAEALAHAEALDDRYRPPATVRPPRWKSPLASVLLVVAGIVAIQPPSLIAPPPRPGVPEDARTLGARASLALQASEVEALRVLNQRLPTPDELGPPFPGVRYVRSNDRVYQLVTFGPDGRALVFDSTEPDAWHDATMQSLLEGWSQP